MSQIKKKVSVVSQKSVAKHQENNKIVKHNIVAERLE